MPQKKPLSGRVLALMTGMRVVRFASPLALAALALFALGEGACGGGGAGAAAPGQSAFRVTGVGASLDPTVRGARLVPESIVESTGYGTEPGGGTRAITAALRVAHTRDGGLMVAEDRFPLAPQLTVALPERVGGGFLYVIGTTVWRSEQWLDRARPIFTSAQAIQGIVPGLDRVYVRAQNAYLAIDGKTGNALDLGPWPASPFVSSFAAADGWRAAAVADLRGVVATFDAGASWRSLELPMDPRQVLASGDGLAVGGIENGKNEAWFEVRADGTVARLSAPPREAKARIVVAPPSPARTYYPGGRPTITLPLPQAPVPMPPEPEAPAREDAADPGERIFGKRPLVAAIEDGWPLTDGTAVVACDGALGRIRLGDGALVDVATAAFPLRPARCHPVSLTRPSAVGAFGFVCGEPRGKTAVYAFDPVRGTLTELKKFDRPRVVTSSGNGALAVRGPCAEDGDASVAPQEPARVAIREDGGDGRDAQAKEPRAKEEARAPESHPYCVLGHDNVWREIHVRSDAAGERVAVLGDGRVAVVSPPSGDVPARLTLLDHGRASTVAVVFPKVAADVARVLRLGLWLDGFEERRPGVLGGWIEAGGVMLGLELALDGKATLGQLVRDAGSPFVAGRYGFGFAQSRRGFETTDGGMTWTPLELPEPLATPAKVERRACGPVGCLAAGWLRIGWGEPKKEPPPPAPPAYRPVVNLAPPQLALSCEPMSPPMPTPPAPRGIPTIRLPASGSSPRLLAPPGGSAPGLAELPPFYAQPGPTLRDGERGLPVELQDLPERYPRLGPLARLYTWGPKTGEWDTQGRFQVKWLSPFAGWPEAHATTPVLPPQALGDLTRGGTPLGFGTYYGAGSSGLFQIATGDDPAHGLLLARRLARGDVTPVELEADHAPLEIRRADGEPFVEIEAVTRMAGRWFFATPSAPAATAPVTTIWQVDGAVARELVRVSRAALETGRPVGTRLARRSDGRSLGLVVDGQPTADRNAATRWVLPIDLESGQLGEPESLGYVDLGGRTLEACGDDVVGWVFDTSLPSTTVRLRTGAATGTLQSVYGRVRLSSSRGCIERVSGMYDGQSAERAAQLTRPGPPPAQAGASRAGEIVAVAFASQSRYALKCTTAAK
ncbi:MAG: hypothetical protein JWP97_1278 [Labilithrix sp.]|nr:hypothetical protein [Labilithrix sp.]